MDKKKIKILTTGVIKTFGYINGPVLTPYYETIERISKLVMEGIKVVEVLDNGTEVELTLNNITKDNTKAVNEDAKKEAAKKAAAKAKEATDLAKKEADEKSKMEEKVAAKVEAESKESVQKEIIVDEPPMKIQIPANNNQNNKHNKHR